MMCLQKGIKRGADIAISIMGLLVLFPLYVSVALAIKITMPGPVFFLQKRAGKNNESFCIFKFRTMKVDNEAEKSFDTSKDTARITALGRFLRRTKMDELPQLINVLAGHMSLVGPRPTFQEQVEQYDEVQARRLHVRPGMTGLAQVQGNAALPWEQRITYDVWYVENFSLWLDMRIIVKTILIVLFGEEKYAKAPLAQGKRDAMLKKVGEK